MHLHKALMLSGPKRQPPNNWSVTLPSILPLSRVYNQKLPYKKKNELSGIVEMPKKNLSAGSTSLCGGTCPWAVAQAAHLTLSVFPM